jgi:aspartate-semialdehyde dehydrogenase
VTRRLLRVAVVGATGAVGAEVLELLEARRFPLQEVVPIATDRSLGESVELLGHEVPVLTAPQSLEGLDLVFVCAPRREALDWVRAALEARVACLDLSGAAGIAREVPLLAADLAPAREALEEPVVACPPGPALAWALVLAPLHVRAGVARVVGTSVEPVSGAGRAGIDSLEAETIALFNQRELPEPTVFHQTVAFDCLPATGEPDRDDGSTELEEALAAHLRRLLGEEVPLALTCLRAPTFAGAGASLAVELRSALSPAECADVLAKAPGVTVWQRSQAGPSTRETVGGDRVLVGRIRRDPTRERGLLLWLAADPIRLAASNALRLAEARFAPA